MRLKPSQLALQFYTLRNFCATAADFAVTCKKVRAIGYKTIQLSGAGSIPEEEVVRILNGEGLVCCATHEPADIIRKEPEKVIARLQKLGVKYTAYPYPAGVKCNRQEDVDLLVRELDAAGAKLRAAGQVLAYHNHAIEFVKLPNGQIALDAIYSRTNPKNVLAEIDTYWVQYGGGDPVEWCQKLKGRLPLLHLKDYGYNIEDKPFYAEIGSGTLNWNRILSAAEASGCEYYIVEQDTCPGDPFDSIKMSFDYLSSNFFAG
ncbi:MAG: sugar phosphate isomerase/epimerase [Methylacidiphilales bacterium]|nr:sugar phosphate isomerase/epimerase [Candidatus Methylacidiphilales bacterium]